MKPVEDSTVIGKSVTIRGELSGSEDLFLDGEIQGTITLPGNRLTVGPNARVLADLNVRDLIVFGQIDGKIAASGRAELRKTAIVNGDILAGRLSIEESASLKGRVEISGPEAFSAAPSTQSTSPASIPSVPEASLFSEQPI